LLPAFHQFLESKPATARSTVGSPPQLLVLAPTRELSTQILDEAVKFGRRLGIRCVCCYGGAPKYPQIAAVAKGVDCIIATPGRLNDLITMKHINLTGIKFFVLDEVRALSLEYLRS
jgi:ATP-dependent RNA helicase DDX5/DBP2